MIRGRQGKWSLRKPRGVEFNLSKNSQIAIDLSQTVDKQVVDPDKTRGGRRSCGTEIVRGHIMKEHKKRKIRGKSARSRTRQRKGKESVPYGKQGRDNVPPRKRAKLVEIRLPMDRKTPVRRERSPIQAESPEDLKLTS